jgi:uncharacterized membrane protein
MEFEASRILSAVGAVLLAAGSFISGLGIVGVILLLVGLKGLADAYREVVKSYRIQVNAPKDQVDRHRWQKVVYLPLTLSS